MFLLYSKAKFLLIFAFLCVSGAFLLFFPYSDLLAIWASFAIHFVDYCGSGYKDHIFGNCANKYKRWLSLTYVGGIVMAGLFYYIDSEILFISIGIFNALAAVIIVFLVNFTHEHPSMLFVLQGINDYLPLTPYKLKLMSRNSALSQYRNLDTQPFVSQNSTYRVNEFGVYSRVN